MWIRVLCFLTMSECVYTAATEQHFKPYKIGLAQ